MNALFFLMMTVALFACLAGVLPDREWVSFTRHEKIIAIYGIFLIAWPLVCSYAIGPLIQVRASGTYSAAISYFPALLIAVAIFASFVLNPNSRIDLAALMQFSSVVIVMVMVVFSGVTPNKLVHLTSAMILLLPTLVKPSAIRMTVVCWSCRISLLAVVVSVFLSSLLDTAVTVGTCRVDKCSVAGQVITSPLADNGNTLGLSLVLLIPFVVHRQTFFRTVLIMLAIMPTVELAGSRTAEAGMVLAILIMIGMWAWPAWRRPILLGGLGIAAAVSLIPVLIPFNNDQFVGRALLWNEARRFIGQNPVLGSGPFAWVTFGVTAIGEANYSPHNGWLDTVLSIGLSGLVILVVAVLLKICLSPRGEADVLIFYFANLLAVSTLESLYVPYVVGIVAFASVLPFLFGTGARADDGAGNDEAFEGAAEGADATPTLIKRRNEWMS